MVLQKNNGRLLEKNFREYYYGDFFLSYIMRLELVLQKEEVGIKKKVIKFFLYILFIINNEGLIISFEIRVGVVIFKKFFYLFLKEI